MPKLYTFAVTATFAFDIRAESEEEAHEKARLVIVDASNSDKWCVPDVGAALFPRVSVSVDDSKTLEIVDTYEEK